MKAREIREQLRGKVEPAVLHVLEALAEEQSHQRQTIHSLSGMLDKMTTIVSSVVLVGERMKETIGRLQGQKEDDDDGSRAN